MVANPSLSHETKRVTLEAEDSKSGRTRERDATRDGQKVVGLRRVGVGLVMAEDG